MAVVDVVLTAGQSQMSGVGTGVDAPSTDPATVFEWDGPVANVLGECYDPWPTSRNSETEYEPQTGSSIPAFANTYTSYSGRKLMMVRSAKGGTAVIHENAQQQGDWSPSGLLFGQSVTKFNAAITALTAAGHTVGNVFVIISIGFRDAQGGELLSTFSDAQTALLTRWRAQLSAPPLKMYIEEMYVPHVNSMTPTLEANCHIVIAEQHESVDASGGDIQIALSGHGDRCYNNGWLKFDGLHYDQNGLNDMGRRFATHIANDMGYSEPAEPPVLTPATLTSTLGKRLSAMTPIPPVPREYSTPGTYTFSTPGLWTPGDDLVFECEGGGGNGGGGGLGLRGSAGGGGAYAKKTITDVVPGETFTLTVGAAGALSQVVRDSTSTVICKAVPGVDGTSGNPNGDGAGGAAASCIGDVTTSGQAGGVTGADNGGAGAAPLGGAGGVWAATSPGTPGTAPGGGGAGADAGSAKIGGPGAAGMVKVTKA